MKYQKRLGKATENQPSINLFEQVCDPETDELLLETLVIEAEKREKYN